MKSVTQGENTYCGPAVLSILTGKSTDECAYQFTLETGRRDISTITMVEMKKVLDRMRYEYKEVAVDCSLYSLMIQVSKDPGFYMVRIWGKPTGHVVALEVTEEHKVLFCDNHTKEPISGAASARLGQRVDVCFKVTPKPEPKHLRSDLEVLVGNGYNNEGKIVYFTVWEVYEREEDNTRREIGTLRVKDLSELKQVVDELVRKTA